MKFLLKCICPGLLIALMGATVVGQRPRVSSDSKPPTSAQLPPAPSSFQAKYEGGVFGYNRKTDGTLIFDDVNKRLVFRDNQQKELLFIPYNAVTAAFGDKVSRRPAAATVASSVPFYGFPAGFIRKHYQYLTLQFSDPDTRVSGVTSFKLQNKEILASVLNALAGKADLTQHGQVFTRRADKTSTSSPE
jgi:hypothetical protein